MIGPRYFERAGLAAPGPAPRGLVESVGELGGPGVDSSRIHPAVAAFFEETASLDLVAVPRWKRRFRLGARMFRSVASLFGQLTLPLLPERISTRMVPLLSGSRERGVVRAYPDGRAMQVVVYSSSRRGDEGVLDVVFPFPLVSLEGVLRLTAIDEDSEGKLSVALGSDGGPGGVWLVVAGRRLRLPLGETMRLWPAGASGAPEVPPWAPEGVTLVGRHEQRLFGVPFVDSTYYFWPVARRQSGQEGQGHGADERGGVDRRG